MKQFGIAIVVAMGLSAGRVRRRGFKQFEHCYG